MADKDIQWIQVALATVYKAGFLASQPLFRWLPQLRGLRSMRGACCTCGAGWTSNALAWDEYIYSALWSMSLDGFGGDEVLGVNGREGQ